MRILHTSDWHLGRTLHGKKRAREFGAFLDWLLSALDTYDVNVLIVAGDVFDTTTPGPLYQQLYYRFLCRAAGGNSRHVVVIGGNHDSPSFLDAPKDLLNFLNVSVTGAASENPADELVTIRDSGGKPALLVCAVPYLRDRDVRSLDIENIQDKERKVLDGIASHYREAGILAEAASASLGGVPIVATGHLFAAGGEISEGDGVRDLYVGSLIRIEAGLFPACFDYVALGHLHSPQKAGGLENIRYSGSPLPMNAREASKGGKRVLLVDLESEASISAASTGAASRCNVSVTELPVPVFQEMAYISGDMETIGRELTELRFRNENIWAEIVHEGRPNPELRDKIMELTAGSGVEILRIKDVFADAQGGLDFSLSEDGAAIAELDESDVFLRCMEKRNVPPEERPGLMETYRQVLASVYEEDDTQF